MWESRVVQKVVFSYKTEIVAIFEATLVWKAGSKKLETETKCVFNERESTLCVYDVGKVYYFWLIVTLKRF